MVQSNSMRWELVVWIVSLIGLLLLAVWFAGQSLLQDSSGENYIVQYSNKYVDWGTFSPPPITTQSVIRIIAPGDSTGTNTDAEIYNRLIQPSRIVFVDMNDVSSHPEVRVHADLNIYVEHLIGVAASPEYDFFPSTYKYLMVNQDMIRSDDIKVLHRVDKFLCKSKAACSALNLPANKVVYTKHTSTDVSAFENDFPARSDGLQSLLLSPSRRMDLKQTRPTSSCGDKDYNLFVHFAGKSWVKNTEEVLRAWITAEGFPELGYPVLLITCRGRCLRGSYYIQRELASFFGPPRDEKSMLRQHSLYPNIFIAESLPDDEYKMYQLLAGYYVCPSQTEGYGHYINEGRSAGAIILTTDASPMNELVDETNGVCIKSCSAFRCTESPNMCYGVNAISIQQGVRYLKSLPKGKLEELSRNSRQRYLDDREYFINTLRDCLTQ